jgi:hypothetical protein
LASQREGRSRRALRLNLAAFILLLGGLLAVGLAELSGPLMTTREQGRELERLRRTKQALLVGRGRLQGEKRYLASEAGQEWAARRRGYVRPGERLLVVVPPEGRSDPAGSGTREAAEAAAEIR